MGKAVQYPVIFRNGPEGFPVVFLIQKVSGLLTVKVIHVKEDPVFPDGNVSVTGTPEETGGLRQTLLGTDRELCGSHQG